MWRNSVGKLILEQRPFTMTVVNSLVDKNMKSATMIKKIYLVVIKKHYVKKCRKCGNCFSSLE